MNWELIFKILGGAFALVASVGSFLYWHFKELNKFKEEIHRLDLVVKDLKHKDELQQQTIDRLGDLYAILPKLIHAKK